MQYLSPFKIRMAFGLIIKAVGTVMDLFLPWILSYIIDDIIPKENIQMTVFWGCIMIVCSFIAWSGNIIANRMASRVAGDCTRALRHDLFEKISYLDASTVDKLTISSLESRITSDTYNVHAMVGMIQRLGVRAPILVIGGLVVSLMLDARLTLILALTMPFIALSVFIISGRGVKLYRKLQNAVDDIVSVVRENATGVRVIKALCKTEYEKKRFDGVNTKAIDIERQAGTIMSLTNPLITFFLNAGLCAVIAAGAYWVDGGVSTNGKIVAFMSYFTIISNATISISRIFTSSSKGIACMDRIDKVLCQEPSLWLDEYADNSNFPEEEASASSAVPPHIEFRNVTFAYDNKKVLDDISFTINHGETLGIIGATGSGKSTIISLLMRMYDVDSGEILIDGVNIKKIPSKKLRERFGAVFQNDFLFADTIYENVSFGRDLSKDVVDDALVKAQASSFVGAYDDKTEHMLDIKGANLSGGQKQRLLIARAIAASPEILILDDSSSALDYKTDAELRRVIRTSMKNTTSIIIAQRISAVMNADKILVLEGGCCIGLGKHDELMEKCDVYRETAEVQMSGGEVIE